MKKYFIYMCVLAIYGCGSAPVIQKGAEVVRISNYYSDSSHLVRVGEVECDFGINGRLTSTNVKYCRTELKNKAYTMGANLVVIDSQSIGNPGCANCVSMLGTAYKDASGIGSADAPWAPSQ